MGEHHLPAVAPVKTDGNPHDNRVAVAQHGHGRFVGASSQPFSEYKRRPGDRRRPRLADPQCARKRAVRHVVFDANYWKSFVYARLATPMGDRGCLSLWGDRPDQHRLLADHLTAEYRVRPGRGQPSMNGSRVPNVPTTTGSTAWSARPLRRRYKGRFYSEPKPG